MIRLLLADDEDLLRGALTALLTLETDLDVVAEASTSTDAVRLARQHRPDIAVLDLEMPPADGLRAAEEIRAESDTGIVLVTRHARPGVLRRALAAGVSGFVAKPTPGLGSPRSSARSRPGSAMSTPTSPRRRSPRATVR